MKKYTETREAAHDVLPRVVEVLIPLSSFSVEVLKTELLRAQTWQLKPVSHGFSLGKWVAHQEGG